MSLLKSGVVFIFLLQTNFQSSYGQDSTLTSDNYLHANPDKLGYRYCAFWQLANGSNIQSTCDPYRVERCGKFIEFQYKCCDGYQDWNGMKLDEDLQGCSEMIPSWISIFHHFNEKKELTDYSRLLRDSQIMSREDDKDTVLTIFAPLSSYRSPSLDYTGANVEAINYTIAKGKYYMEQLSDQDIIPTMYNGEFIRVSKYPYGVMCLDCIEVVKSDQEVREGLVYHLRDSLKPKLNYQGEVERETIYGYLSANKDTASFAEDLSLNPELSAILYDVHSKELFTVLVPPKEEWEKIREEYSEEELADIVRDHIIPRVYCSAGIFKSFLSLQTLNNRKIHFYCKSSDDFLESRTINFENSRNVKIIQNDIMTGNGVIHRIDKPLISFKYIQFPEFVESSQKEKIKTFIQELKACGIEIGKNTNYTLLIPYEYAFVWFKNSELFREEYKKYTSDREYACETIRYHIVTSSVYNETLFNGHNRSFKTLTKGDYKIVGFITKNKYGSQFNMNYASLNGKEIIQLRDNLMIYQIPRVLILPRKQTIMEFLESSDEFKGITSVFNAVNFKENVLKINPPMNLVLVYANDLILQSNDAKISYKTVYENYFNEDRENYAKFHVLTTQIWLDDVGTFAKNSLHTIRTIADYDLMIYVNEKKEVYVGFEDLPFFDWSRVIRGNINTVDGMVWQLDRVLPCPKKLCTPRRKIQYEWSIVSYGCIGLEEDPKNYQLIDDYRYAAGNTDRCNLEKKIEGIIHESIDLEKIKI